MASRGSRIEDWSPEVESRIRLQNVSRETLVLLRFPQSRIRLAPGPCAGDDPSEGISRLARSPPAPPPSSPPPPAPALPATPRVSVPAPSAVASRRYPASVPAMPCAFAYALGSCPPGGAARFQPRRPSSLRLLAVPRSSVPAAPCVFALAPLASPELKLFLVVLPRFRSSWRHPPISPPPRRRPPRLRPRLLSPPRRRLAPPPRRCPPRLRPRLLPSRRCPALSALASAPAMPRASVSRLRSGAPAFASWRRPAPPPRRCPPRLRSPGGVPRLRPGALVSAPCSSLSRDSRGSRLCRASPPGVFHVKHQFALRPTSCVSLVWLSNNPHLVGKLRNNYLFRFSN